MVAGVVASKVQRQKPHPEQSLRVLRLQRSGPMSKPSNRWLSLQLKSSRLRSKRSRKLPRLLATEPRRQGRKKSLRTRKRDHAAAAAAEVVVPAGAKTKILVMMTRVRARRVLPLQMSMHRTRWRPMQAKTNRERAMIERVDAPGGTVTL